MPGRVARRRASLQTKKETLRAGLAMARVTSKKMAQDAVNAALAVFSDAVKAAIGAGL